MVGHEKNAWHRNKISDSGAFVRTGVFRLVLGGSVRCFPLADAQDFGGLAAAHAQPGKSRAHADVAGQSAGGRSERTAPARGGGSSGRGCAFYGGLRLSGHVPKPHGLAGPSWRVDRRGIRRGIGAFAGSWLWRGDGAVFHLWPARGSACVSHFAREQNPDDACDGARGRDDQLSFYLRHLLY